MAIQKCRIYKNYPSLTGVHNRKTHYNIKCTEDIEDVTRAGNCTTKSAAMWEETSVLGETAETEGAGTEVTGCPGFTLFSTHFISLLASKTKEGCPSSNQQPLGPKRASKKEATESCSGFKTSDFLGCWPRRKGEGDCFV